MAELFNLHTAPVTVTDVETGKRVSIPRGHSALVAGDFRNHLFVQAGLIRADHDDSDTAQQTDAPVTDISALREQYETLLGKKAPSAAKVETLQKAIDDALAQPPDETIGETE